MATIRLTPSTYYLSNSSYLSVQNADNMYDDTDSDTYGTVTNSQTSTSSYYIYLRGFNFDDIPSNAVIDDFDVKFKARESGVSTSSSYRPYMCHGTTTITGTCSAVSTTAYVQTFSGVTADWETISGYGDTFGIRFNCRRASRNTTSHMYLYGAEIEVTYHIPTPRQITTTLSGDGTIDPSGTNTYYDGDEITLTITPTDGSAEVTATKDGSAIILTQHSAGGTENAVLGDFTLISGSFNGSGQTYFSGIVGNGVDASQTSSNYYSGSSGTNAVFQYEMGFVLPSTANITRVWCEVNGHAESTSQSSEYMCVQLKSGSVELSDEINFKSIGTSNTTITLEAEILPTVDQLESMVLECTLGYYGGAINGATAYVQYTVPGGGYYYTYTWTVDANTTIAVTIGGGSSVAELYKKISGTWTLVATAYKKSGSSWASQSDVTAVFDTTQNYING